MSSLRSGKTAFTIFEVLFIIFNIFFFIGIAKKSLWSQPIPGKGLFSYFYGSQGGASGFRLNVLCMGIDAVDGTHRTDTLLLVGIDTSAKKISIVSIPRDSRVVIEGTSRKVNEVYARYGVEMLRTLIEELMEIRINRHVKIDFNGFINVMDLIGGIDLTIEHPMNYDDNYGNVHIHFASGPAHLDGQKALEYVRFRADANADLGRIKRQQRFIGGVIEKISQPSIILKIPDILREAFKHAQTDLTFQETLELAYSLKDRNFKIQSESLPGEARYVDKVSYFIPFQDQAAALGAKWFADFSTIELDASFTVPLSSGS